MKKIYIFAAVLALLTLSLNAQMLPYKAIGKESVYQDKGKPGSTAGLFHAPAKINTANGEFLVGPYTTDDFSTTGKGLYNTTSYGRVEVSTVIPRSDIEQYIGQEIVGYRFATVGGTVSCYSFLVESEGPNYYINDLYYWNIQSDGSYIDLSGNQWHEYYLDEPVVFQIPDTTQAIWIGYKYYQESSNNGSYTMTPIAVNPNVTSYECYAYSYNQNNQGFYDVTSTLGGAVAAQLIFKAPSTDPKITASPTSVSMSTSPGETVTETVTVTGQNLTDGITYTISGNNASLFSVSPTSLGTSGGTLTITYSPTADGTHTATLTLSSTGAQDVVITLNGTCSSDITICDGTNTNDFLPIYGFYNDDYQINQMIYPESLLADLVGKTLTSMTFYANAALDANLSTTAWNVKLGTTNQTTFASSLSDITRLVPGDVTTVAEGYVVTSGINTMTITFTTPFTYNGGNLLVDFQSTAEGQYKATTFYGVNQSTYTGYNSYRSSNSTPNQNGHYSSGGVRQFLPKVTFTYENTTNPELAISPATQTINDAAAGALTVTGTDIDGNINVSAADNDWTVNPTSLTGTGGNVNVTYTGRDLSASTTVTASATGATDATATVDYVADLYIVGDYGTGWNFNDNSNQMSYNNGTYTATITVNANAYILFARLLGNDNPWNTRDVFGPVSEGNWGMVGDSHGGNIDLNDDDPIHFPEGGTYRITINANNGTFTITKLSGEQTAQPVITYSLSSDGQHVTITATGDGTVTLNVPGYDPISGEGEVSITVPCGYVSNTITVSATAQESGKDESDPTYRDITIPAGSDWVEMDGTYDNPNDLLSFLKNNEDIMMVDQFAASTLKNEHPDHYTYTLRQTVNGETETSTPVTIPVYKTSSTMQGLYTQNQVTGDTDMKLKPNVFNTEMDYEVNPDRNVMYYSLYRGEIDAYYPLIKADQRKSQLQKFEEMVGEGENAQPQYFMFETHQAGVAPRYDHVGNQIVERLDTNWVEGTLDQMLAYVPVIWTNGLYTARGDGKDNSYGSDIKREYMGKVTANITGQISQGVYGTWEDVNGTTYRAFHPTIVATGYLPQNDNNNAVNYNDGDVAHYVPYLCRAWCTNEGIHDYGRDADGQLTDLGELPTPFLVGEATFGDDMTATIGGDWTQGSVRDPWSFGLPASVTESQVTFKIRFYYKKVVTDAQAQQNGGNGAKLGNEAEEYFMAETEGNANDMIVGINEFMNGIVPVDVTYVNPQGMQSSRPFDGVNIVVTRYSDGSTRTSKIVR